MRVGVIGVNHKLADLKLRERFAKICQQRFSSGKSAHGKHTLLLLSTCNRTEVYFSSDDLTDTHSYIINILRRDLHDTEEAFDQKLYSYFGHACFKHLARVTSGLDSAIVAETEIQGQVKAAYQACADWQLLPSEMHFLFQKALKIGKRIRTELGLGRDMPNLEHAILNAGYHMFGNPEKLKVLFVGASEINCKILLFLKSKGFRSLTLCNRTFDTAKRIAEKHQVNLLEWERLASWPGYDIAVFGTKSPEYLVRKQDIENEEFADRLLIDLCVPRNVDPKLGRDPRITLLNIDQINRSLKIRKQRMTHLLTNAEDFASEATKTQIELFQSKLQKRERLLAEAS